MTAPPELPAKGSFFGDGTGRPRLIWRIVIALAGVALVHVIPGIVLVVLFLALTGNLKALQEGIEQNLPAVGAAVLLASAGTVGLLIMLRRHYVVT